jgi:hypothetical protein
MKSGLKERVGLFRARGLALAAQRVDSKAHHVRSLDGTYVCIIAV